MLSVFTLLDGKAGQNYPGHIALTIFWNNILWEDTKIFGATYIHTVTSQSRGLWSEILLDNIVAKRKKIIWLSHTSDLGIAIQKFG